MPRTRKPRCIAHVRAAWNPNAWVPCSRRQVRNSVFCRRHEDAFRGAVLGMWVEILSEAEDAEPRKVHERPN